MISLGRLNVCWFGFPLAAYLSQELLLGSSYEKVITLTDFEKWLAKRLISLNLFVILDHLLFRLLSPETWGWKFTFLLYYFSPLNLEITECQNWLIYYSICNYLEVSQRDEQRENFQVNFLLFFTALILNWREFFREIYQIFWEEVRDFEGRVSLCLL